MQHSAWSMGAATPDGEPDIVLRAADGRPLARVELRNLPSLTPDDAAALRHNLLAQSVVTDGAFFMLLSQDRGFLWVPAHAGPAGVPADVIFPMGPVVARFVQDFDDRRRLSHGELRLIAIGWLHQMLAGDTAPTQEPERALAEAGFLPALQRGFVALELAS